MSESSQVVVLIPLSNINVLKDRGRKKFDNILELADSIKTNGLLHPIAVVPTVDGKPGTFDLVAGERRYRAHLFLSVNDDKYAKIPAILHEFSSHWVKKEVELMENLQRSQLDWPEQCELLRQIDELKRAEHGDIAKGSPTEVGVKREGWSLDKTAQLVKESPQAVSTKLKIAVKMKERPDLAEKVKHLPMSAALKEVERIETVEKVERMHSQGSLTITDQLIEGNAKDVLATLPENSIDLIVTDPPFGISILDEYKGSISGTRNFTGTLKENDNSTEENVAEMYKWMCLEHFRVLKPGAHCYVFFTPSLYQALVDSANAAGFEVDPTPLIWDKKRTTGAFTGYGYMACYEMILFMVKPPRTRRLSEQAKSILQFSPPGIEERIPGVNHPFQKPLELLTFLIKQSSNIGSVVLDPFAGSASTLVAGLACGRSVLGVELDHERFLGAQFRLHTVKRLEAKPIESK